MNAAPREQEWGVGNLTKTYFGRTAHSLDEDVRLVGLARRRRGGAAEQLEIEDCGGEGARLGHRAVALTPSLALLVPQVGRLERLAAQGVAEPAAGGAPQRSSNARRASATRGRSSGGAWAATAATSAAMRAGASVARVAGGAGRRRRWRRCVRGGRTPIESHGSGGGVRRRRVEGGGEDGGAVEEGGGAEDGSSVQQLEPRAELGRRPQPCRRRGAAQSRPRAPPTTGQPPRRLQRPSKLLEQRRVCSERRARRAAIPTPPAPVVVRVRGVPNVRSAVAPPPARPPASPRGGCPRGRRQLGEQRRQRWLPSPRPAARIDVRRAHSSRTSSASAAGSAAAVWRRASSGPQHSPRTQTTTCEPSGSGAASRNLIAARSRRAPAATDSTSAAGAAPPGRLGCLRGVRGGEAAEAAAASRAEATVRRWRRRGWRGGGEVG